MVDIIAVAIIILWIILAIRSIRKRKSLTSCGCSKDCNQCSGCDLQNSEQCSQCPKK